METNVFLQNIYGCAAEAGTGIVLDISINPLFKECRPIGLSELPQCFPCSVPLQSWVALYLQILTHYGYCEGSDSSLYNASQTAQLWKSDPWVHTGMLVPSQMMPQWYTTPISEIRKKRNFLIPLGKCVWDRHSPQWKVDGNCCHAVSWCCPYWFGPHLSVPSSLLQSPRFL